ncbi:MAG: hypothetical protein ABII80_03770 [bacterium]
MQDLESVHKVYPYSERDKMGIELWNMIQEHPTEGDWKKGWAGVGLMLNSASHDDGPLALSMVVEDAVRSHDKGVPIDVVSVALRQVVKWRSILLETQPEKEPVIGDISTSDLQLELEKVLPPDYVKQLFE